ncbi:MAG: branched-chain amino acid ABC transporter permease [Candidatus Pacebacteria bacterium]|nr:branched-chain amino acid ABC transporter permease [Candidatus Paceibacterota bacterium]
MKVKPHTESGLKTWVGLAALVLAMGLFYFGIPALIAQNPEVYSRYYTTLSGIALLSMASAGVWLTFYIGRINIGQGVFCLFGAYISGILVVNYGMNFWYSAIWAGVICSLLSFLIGLPILRLRGVYFAMVTLISTQVATLVVQNLAITKQGRSFALPPPAALTLPGTDIVVIPAFTLEGAAVGFYFAAITLMILTFLGLYRLVNSRIGQLCKSLQQNEELASSLGVNIVWLRLVAYAISCFVGGVAGAFYGAQQANLNVSLFTVQDSVNFLLYCFMGGLNYVVGPLIGTITLRLGWDQLSPTGEYQLAIYALALIILMFILPNGLMSLVEEGKKWFIRPNHRQKLQSMSAQKPVKTVAKSAAKKRPKTAAKTAPKSNKGRK